MSTSPDVTIARVLMNEGVVQFNECFQVFKMLCLNSNQVLPS